MRTTPQTASTTPAYDARATPPPSRFRRLLAGVRGAPSDESLLRVVARVAQRHGAEVTAATVFRPRVLAPQRWSTQRHRIESDERRDAAAWLRGVRAQLHRLKPVEDRWTLYRAVGDPGTELARAAARHDADLTVIGIGRETAPEREFGSHVAMRLAQLAGAPLLAVARACPPAWHKAVVLLDGRRHDTVVLRAVAALLESPARITVIAPPAVADAPVRAESERLGVKVRYEHTPSARDAEVAALDAAGRTHADVLALPLYGDSPAVRALTNYRAVRVLGAASCSVLLVPDAGWSPDLLG